MLVNNSKDKGWEEIIELLANESRRRILQLLTKKPCYVSEISYALRMAPKVVLEHLEKLEKAGIIRSYEEGRRRYYYIDRTFNISITISPHRFAIEVIGEQDGDLQKTFSEVAALMNRRAGRELSEVFERLRDMERAFRMLQKDISDRIDELIDRMIVELDRMRLDEISKVVLYALIKGLDTPEKISQTFGIPYEEVNLALTRLEKSGLVSKVEDGGVVRLKLRWRGDANE
ncbi:MAG: metalloregulator ArsR/SmtB family transcription factor [Archaeoglobi archaeon]|nr:metalloregulator ArsR/SmtB family transcription factor [Archaeoglobi archaeon]